MAAPPLLRLHAVTLFVRDRERSARFFVDTLGFSSLTGPAGAGEPAWLAVAPPDGTAVIALVQSDADPLPDAGTPALVLLTGDVPGRYDAWTRRGVRFRQPPLAGAWGGAHAVFEDPDGHLITLAAIDPLTRELDAARQAEAVRAERERHAQRELRLAADVQARLLPQAMPPVPTLDYAAGCRQARAVGGDYFDVLRLGGDRLALLLADVSGKGMPAALLMASLQAHVRAACLETGGEPARLLAHVNQRFWDTSPSNTYASMIYAVHDAGTGRIRYANCGHPPALIARRDGRLEELPATAPVLGLFDAWTCAVDETTLAPGDRLVLYSDGVTEAIDGQGEEFGQARLAAAIRAADGSAAALVDRITSAVLAFGGPDQYDDLTLVAAIGR